MCLFWKTLFLFLNKHIFRRKKRAILFRGMCRHNREHYTWNNLVFLWNQYNVTLLTSCHYFIAATSFYWCRDPHYRMDPLKQHTAHPFDPKLSVLLFFMFIILLSPVDHPTIKTIINILTFLHISYFIELQFVPSSSLSAQSHTHM